MQTLIYGSGAVGGYFGARLHQHGVPIHFLARGTQLAALQQNGIRLNSVDGDYAAPVDALAQLADAPAPDLVLLAVKSHDVAAAATELARHLPAHTQVLALQNGIGHLDILKQTLGDSRVVAATVFLGAQVSAPGIIRHSAAGFMRIGADPQGSHPAINTLANYLETHGLKVTQSPHIRLDMWKKFLWNAGFNGPSALTQASVGSMTRTPGISSLIRALIAEAVAVGQACGIDLASELVNKTFAQTKGLGDFKTSMLQDVLAGRPIENQAFYGYLLEQGARHSVETPYCQMVHDALLLRFATPGMEPVP